MSPARISFTVDGKEGGSVTCRDGTTGVLSTPVGYAQAEVGDYFLAGRYAKTILPGDKIVYLFATSRPSFLQRFAQKINLDEPNSRSKTYQTVEGEVVIDVNVW